MSLFREQVQFRRSRLHGSVVLRQPNGNWLLALLLVGILVAGGTWLSVGTYARIESAPGILTTDRPTAKVYSPRPGVASSVFVREGDIVRAGQPLLIVNADVRDAGGNASAARSAEAVTAQLAIQEQKIRLVESAHASESARVSEAIVSLEDQLRLTDSAIALQDDIVESQRAVLAQLQTVAENGFMSRNEFERRRQAYLAATQQQISLTQQRSGLARQIAEGRIQLRNAAIVRKSRACHVGIECEDPRATANAVRWRRSVLAGGSDRRRGARYALNDRSGVSRRDSGHVTGKRSGVREVDPRVPRARFRRSGDHGGGTIRYATRRTPSPAPLVLFAPDPERNEACVVTPVGEADIGQLEKAVTWCLGRLGPLVTLEVPRPEGPSGN